MFQFYTYLQINFLNMQFFLILTFYLKFLCYNKSLSYLKGVQMIEIVIFLYFQDTINISYLICPLLMHLIYYISILIKNKLKELS